MCMDDSTSAFHPFCVYLGMGLYRSKSNVGFLLQYVFSSRAIPEVLDRLALHEPASIPVYVDGAAPGQFQAHFDPRKVCTLWMDMLLGNPLSHGKATKLGMEIPVSLRRRHYTFHSQIGL